MLKDKISLEENTCYSEFESLHLIALALVNKKIVSVWLLELWELCTSDLQTLLTETQSFIVWWKYLYLSSLF